MFIWGVKFKHFSGLNFPCKKKTELLIIVTAFTHSAINVNVVSFHTTEKVQKRLDYVNTELFLFICMALMNTTKTSVAFMPRLPKETSRESKNQTLDNSSIWIVFEPCLAIVELSRWSVTVFIIATLCRIVCETVVMC